MSYNQQQYFYSRSVYNYNPNVPGYNEDDEIVVYRNRKNYSLLLIGSASSD